MKKNTFNNVVVPVDSNLSKENKEDKEDKLHKQKVDDTKKEKIDTFLHPKYNLNTKLFSQNI
jgi:hypothetical protein